jgi:ABC-type phosphate transport system auxiliary subunit
MSTGKFKLLNGVEIEMTQAELDEQTKSDTEIFNEHMENLRAKRNRLLTETDFYALSDVTMSSEIETYRQELRDLTNELTTVEQVNAVTWPTKPGA